MKILFTYSRTDLLFVFSAFTLIICLPPMMLGRIITDFFYTPGQILELLGTLGTGAAFAGIAILAILKPEPASKWSLMPPSPVRSFLVRLGGILLLLAIIGMMVQATWSFIVYMG